MSKWGNESFYKGKAWRKVSLAYMTSRNYICERCGKPASICHHRKWLNSVNVNDPYIALNPDNLECLCIDCHNAEHASKHDKPVFNDSGEIVEIKESPETKAFKKDREAINELLRKLKANNAV